MSIMRGPRPQANYTVIRNELLSAALSAEALGVMCYLLSKPDNWQVSKKELGRHFSIGRDKVNRIINELLALGYMETHQPRSQSGKLLESVIICLEEPKVRRSDENPTDYGKSAPITEKPLPVEPLTVNPYQINTDNKQSTERTYTAGGLFGDLEQSAFDMFKATASAQGLPVPMMLNETRRAQLRGRLRECGDIEGWAVAMDKLASSPYLTGKVNGWKADIDFILQQTRFAKLMEGGYDAKINTPTERDCRNTARREAIERANFELAAEFG